MIETLTRIGIAALFCAPLTMAVLGALVELGLKLKGRRRRHVTQNDDHLD